MDGSAERPTDPVLRYASLIEFICRRFGCFDPRLLPSFRVAHFLQPESLFTTLAFCSGGMRRATFCFWLHTAVEKLAKEAATVISLPPPVLSSVCIEAGNAAQVYMSLYVQTRDFTRFPGPICMAAMETRAAICKAAMETRAAARTVVSRCICREVGFHSELIYRAKLEELFLPYLVEDAEVMSKMRKAFHHDCYKFKVPNAFLSEQRKGRSNGQGRSAAARSLSRGRGQSGQSHRAAEATGRSNSRRRVKIDAGVVRGGCYPADLPVHIRWGGLTVREAGRQPSIEAEPAWLVLVEAGGGAPTGLSVSYLQPDFRSCQYRM